MGNPYHDESGKFTSGDAAMGSSGTHAARMTMPGDKVSISKVYGGGRGVIKEFSPSKAYAIVQVGGRRGTEMHDMSSLKVTGRGEAGRSLDIRIGIKSVGHK